MKLKNIEMGPKEPKIFQIRKSLDKPVEKIHKGLNKCRKRP